MEYNSQKNFVTNFEAVESSSVQSIVVLNIVVLRKFVDAPIVVQSPIGVDDVVE